MNGPTAGGPPGRPPRLANPYAPPIGLTFASPGVRLLARIIDLIAAVACGMAVMSTATAISSQATELAGGLLVVVVLLYEWLPTAVWGGTPGKLLLRIRVVRLDQGPAGYLTALGRALTFWLFWVIPIVGLLDKIWLLWDRPLTQCLHDKAAVTMVVCTPR